MTGSLRLRLLRSDDASVMRVWISEYLTEHLRWWSESLGEAPWSDERIQEHLDAHGLVGVHWRDLERASESTECFVRVACDAERPMGVVSAELRLDRYLKVQMGVIAWVYVAPEDRRQGIANRLLEAAEGWMTWKDVAGRELFVTHANAPALEAYRKRGFRLVDDRMLGPPPRQED